MRKRWSSLVTKFSRPYWASTKAVWADSLTAVAVALLTASGALLVEDLLAKPPESGTVVPGRLTFAVVMLILVFVGMYLRNRVRRAAGTLVSIQVLDAAMGDRTLGENSRTAAQKRTMSIRTLHRWSDLAANTADGVIDVAPLCAEVGRSAELLVNTAQDDERIAVAPNLLWPMALGVGGYLPLAEFNTRFVELSTEDNRGSEEFALDMGVLAGPPKIEPAPGEQADAMGNRVGVAVRLTQDVEAGKAEAILRSFGVSTVHHVVRPDGIGVASMVEGRPKIHFSGPELRELAGRLALRLAEIKKSCGERELVVTAQIPKTVALVAGWYLAQLPIKFFHGTYLMHYSPQQGSTPMRVNEAQARAF